MKGNGLFQLLVEGIISIFVAIILLVVLVPVLSQLNSPYVWVFYMSIVALIFSVIVAIFAKIARW